VSEKTDLSTPHAARDHARSQAGTQVRGMPTIPASSAKDIPPGVRPNDLLWDETIDAGEYCARILPRGSRLRITNLDGDACANLILFNADRTIERLNVADTAKVQWNAYIGKGSLLLSDMGRVMMSITEDTSGKFDAFCGCSNQKTNAHKYGCGDNYGPCPNARDRLLLALLKYGLGRKDIPPNLNLFQSVRIEPDGRITFLERAGTPREYVELRAEMNLLLAAANTPHVLDPRPQYVCKPVRFTAWRGQPTPENDPIRNASPESLRAFQNTEDFFLS
jgi:urea carboxylase-associated protein 2